MSTIGGRHTELFGPDFARGPFAASRIEVAALQIATQLAQLRTPLLRSDSEIDAHAEYIQALAEKLAPDSASAIKLDVGDEITNNISVNIRTNLNAYSLLEVWLVDAVGGAITAVAPTTVTWNTGSVIAEFNVRKHYLVVTNNVGVASVTISYALSRSWYLAVARHGRVYHSSQLFFA